MNISSSSLVNKTSNQDIPEESSALGNLKELPTEVIFNIFSHLKDLTPIPQLNRNFQSLVIGYCDTMFTAQENILSKILDRFLLLNELEFDEKSLAIHELIDTFIVRKKGLDINEKEQLNEDFKIPKISLFEKPKKLPILNGKEINVSFNDLIQLNAFLYDFEDLFKEILPCYVAEIKLQKMKDSQIKEDNPFEKLINVFSKEDNPFEKLINVVSNETLQNWAEHLLFDTPESRVSYILNLWNAFCWVNHERYEANSNDKFFTDQLAFIDKILTSSEEELIESN